VMPSKWYVTASTTAPASSNIWSSNAVLAPTQNQKLDGLNYGE
jgi:hypothetical protein